MKLRNLGVLGGIAALTLTACGSGATTAPTQGAASTPAATQAGSTTPTACQGKTGSSSTEIHVYSSFPLQGTNTPQTSAMVSEIKTVLDGKKVGNFTIKYTSLDDSSAANNGDWDGAVEQANANTAANDPDAMIYIGTFNSGAAKLSIPILNSACLVMISPANTYPGLTHAVNGVTAPGEPDNYYPGGFRNYSRVIATDDIQGGAAAEWAQSLGATKAYVLDDGQTYGQGLARSFALHFGKIGGQVLSASGSSEPYDPKATDYAALAQKIKSAGADIIYIGAITGNGTAKLWKDLRSALPDVKIMSGDGVNEKTWADGAGAASNGTYLTFGGVDPGQLTGTGKTWLDAYKTANGGNTPPVYAPYANAAAAVALAGITKAATNDRWAILKAVMATTSVDTVVGSMTFDANGDAKGGTISSYTMGAAWPPDYKGVITVAKP